MNSTRFNQIIDEVYEKYHQENKKVVYLTFLLKEEFINKCKTDLDFSQKWGLKIEERELSLEERHQISLSRIGHNGIVDRDNITWHETYNKTGIPTKIITITHNNETIESYER